MLFLKKMEQISQKTSSRFLSWWVEGFFFLILCAQVCAVVSVGLGLSVRFLWASFITLLWSSTQALSLGFAVRRLVPLPPWGVLPVASARAVCSVLLFAGSGILALLHHGEGGITAFLLSAVSAFLCVGDLFLLLLPRKEA